jgi:hypothetical protein
MTRCVPIAELIEFCAVSQFFVSAGQGLGPNRRVGWLLVYCSEGRRHAKWYAEQYARRIE